MIPEKKEKLESASTGGGKLFASYLKDASTRIYQYNTDGSGEKQVMLPAIGSAGTIVAYKDDNIAFYDFSSFTYPPSTYMYDITTGKSVVFKKSTPNVKTDDYTTEQIFYTSKDGTKVPMFIVHKKANNFSFETAHY